MYLKMSYFFLWEGYAEIRFSHHNKDLTYPMTVEIFSL